MIIFNIKYENNLFLFKNKFKISNKFKVIIFGFGKLLNNL